MFRTSFVKTKQNPEKVFHQDQLQYDKLPIKE